MQLAVKIQTNFFEKVCKNMGYIVLPKENIRNTKITTFSCIVFTIYWFTRH